MQLTKSFLSQSAKVLLLAATAGIAPHVFAANVPIPNGSFEATGKAIPNWAVSNASKSKGSGTIDAATAHSGQKSLHIVKTNAEGYMVLRGGQVKIDATKKYDLSAWLSSKTASKAKVYFMIGQSKTGSKKRIKNIFGPVRPLDSKPGTWKKLKLLYAPQPGIDHIRIFLIITAAPIDLHVDDVQLNSVAATSKPPATTNIAPHVIATGDSVPNGSFETAGKAIPNWKFGSYLKSESHATIDTTVAHDGHNSLHIVKTNKEGDDVLASEKIAVAANTKYAISAWLNSKTVSKANVYFMISQYKAGSKKREKNLFGPVRPLGSKAGQWKELKFLYTPLPGIDHIQISLVITAAPIDLYVDDVQLHSLPSTSQPSASKK